MCPGLPRSTDSLSPRLPWTQHRAPSRPGPRTTAPNPDGLQQPRPACPPEAAEGSLQTVHAACAGKHAAQCSPRARPSAHLPRGPATCKEDTQSLTVATAPREGTRAHRSRPPRSPRHLLAGSTVAPGGPPRLSSDAEDGPLPQLKPPEREGATPGQREGQAAPQRATYFLITL